MWKNCPSVYTVEVTRWCYKRPRNCKNVTIKKTLRPWAHKKKRKKVAIPDVIFGAFTQGQHSSKGSLFFILCGKAHVRRDKFLFFNFLSVSWHKGYLMLSVFKIFILEATLFLLGGTQSNWIHDEEASHAIRSMCARSFHNSTSHNSLITHTQ